MTFRIVIIFALLATATNALARPLTAKDLVMLARVENPVVSPDGKWLVWEQRETDLAANKTRRDLWRMNLLRVGALSEKVALVKGLNARAPAFDSNSRLYFLSDKKNGKTTIWSLAMAGGKPTPVTQNDDLAGFKFSPKGDALLVWANRPVGARSLDDTEPPQVSARGSARIFDRLFVRHWDKWADGKRSQLFVIPMLEHRALGAGHAVEGALVGDTPSQPTGGAEEITWSLDGRTLYFVLRQAGQNEALSTNFDIFSAPADGSSPPVNLTADNPAIDTLPVVSPDGRWLAWVATMRAGYEADRKVLMLRNLSTGEIRVLTAAWDRSIDSIAWAYDSASIYVTAADMLDHPVFRITAATGAVSRLTSEGHVSDITPLPQGGLVYLLDTLTTPADLWRRDENGVTSQLTKANATRLVGIDWPVVTRFSFQGANTDTIWGLIMRPKSVAPDIKTPIAFLVHGGPQGSASDAWSYPLNRAVFASGGYASVSIDFHGSIGYGQAFTDSINNDWGNQPLLDLKLGLKAATDRFTFLDTDKVCGIGGSYGGYMMNWIEGNWPDRFKCLIQDDGVFDVRAMVYETDELWADKWDRVDRLYYEAPADYERSNPVNLVALWRTPMLVITGENDFRTPYTQAIAAFTALQLRNIPSRLIVFPDENHIVQKPLNRVQWYEEVLHWMNVGIQRNGSLPPSQTTHSDAGHGSSG